MPKPSNSRIYVGGRASMEYDRSSRDYEDLVRTEASRAGYLLLQEQDGLFLYPHNGQDKRGPYHSMRQVRAKLFEWGHLPS